MTTTPLKHFVRAFRDGLLDGADPEDWCYLVSAPLQVSLKALGIECALVNGGVYDECHFWIELPDGMIIDATASQFRRPNGLPFRSFTSGRCQSGIARMLLTTLAAKS